MDAKKTAIFCDLDGTLFNSQAQISINNRRAIEQFIRKGGIFCISTGRTPQNALRFLNGLPVNGPSTFFNGSVVYDYRTKRILYHAPLTYQRTKAFLKKVLERHPALNVQVYTANDIIFVSPEETAHSPFLELHRPCIFRSIDMTQVEWCKSLIEGEHEELLAVKAVGEEELGDAVKFVFSNPKYLELLPIGADKGTALAFSMRTVDLSRRKSFAIGDYNNDVEMLQTADYGIAPGNALECAKSAAKFIVNDNDHDALADLIQNVIPSI